MIFLSSVWLPHRVNDTVSVRIGYAENVLVADGTDPSRYVKPRLAELIFDFVKGTEVITENKTIYRYTDCLRENEKLNKRSDQNEILYLIGQLSCGNYNIRHNKDGNFYEENILYMGVEYKYMDY